MYVCIHTFMYIVIPMYLFKVKWEYVKKENFLPLRAKNFQEEHFFLRSVLTGASSKGCVRGEWEKSCRAERLNCHEHHSPKARWRATWLLPSPSLDSSRLFHLWMARRPQDLNASPRRLRKSFTLQVVVLYFYFLFSSFSLHLVSLSYFIEILSSPYNDYCK